VAFVAGLQCSFCGGLVDAMRRELSARLSEVNGLTIDLDLPAAPVAAQPIGEARP
jgi:hypothetical protein